LHNDTNEDYHSRVYQALSSAKSVSDWGSNKSTDKASSLQSRYDIGLEVSKLGLGAFFRRVETKASRQRMISLCDRGRWTFSLLERRQHNNATDNLSWSVTVRSANLDMLTLESMPKSMAPKPAEQASAMARQL
jgi:hypothetical protein